MSDFTLSDITNNPPKQQNNLNTKLPSRNIPTLHPHKLEYEQTYSNPQSDKDQSSSSERTQSRSTTVSETDTTENNDGNEDWSSNQSYNTIRLLYRLIHSARNILHMGVCSFGSTDWTLLALPSKHHPSNTSQYELYTAAAYAHYKLYRYYRFNIETAKDLGTHYDTSAMGGRSVFSLRTNCYSGISKR